MKIVKAGNLPQERVLTGKCYNCKCVIEATVGECESVTDPRDGVTTYSYNCPTPRCGSAIGLSPKKQDYRLSE